ncbi:MAG: ATP-dependent Clp protease ATP-binding subunit [Nocardiaceae bacterium]|nr:ATP-dependent Clp protease ATP-binding subunit [Nocardiaceae bacterium]
MTSDAMKNIRLDELIEGIRRGYPEKPLEQLTAAVMIADHIGEVSDHLIGHFVDQARRSGASWTDIGGSIGVTRQAAQQRFTPKEDANMFTRFTDKARLAIVTAQEKARKLGNTDIQIGHLILGLTASPDSLAIKALAAQNVTVEQLTVAATGSINPAAEGAEIPTMIPFDGASKKALELTVREALRLGHNYVGTEHLLLALIDQSAIFAPLGVEAAATEKFILDVLETVQP